MKILIVCQNYYPENFTIHKIAEKLVSFGHEVDVLTGKPNYGFGEILPEYENISFEVINGVNVHRVKIIPRGKNKISIIQNYLSFWYFGKKWARKCKTKYDIVYSMSLSPVTLLAPANLYKKKHHVKHICHCVDLWPESTVVTNAIKPNSLFYKVLYFWSKKLYKGCDKILIGSPSFSNYFKNVLHLQGNYEFLPQSALHTKLDESEPFVFNDDKFHVLYCGNIGTIQLVELIPEAMSYVTNKNVHFDIIGFGAYQDKVIDAIKANHVEDKITYYGHMRSEDTRKYFKAADCLYVSLKNSGYVGKTIPNKLTMSMAYEKPIIGVLVGDGKDVLEKANGGIISTQDPKEIAKAIDEIASLNKEKLAQMGKSNYKYYLENFDIDSISHRLEEILKENL